MTTTTVTTEAITAETMLRLFPDIDTNDEALSGHDEEQIRLMDEVCIVLDNNDIPIGKASKKICTSLNPTPVWLLAKANILLCRPPHVQY
jgi:isopentenyl-diphosphate delta-isomerase